MDEKDQKSLSIGDILDQLVKPSVIQGPPFLGSTTPPSPMPSISGREGSLNLPKIGEKAVVTPPSPPIKGLASSGFVQPKLTIRTMASDIVKLKGETGDRVSSSYVRAVPSEISLPERTTRQDPPKAIEKLPRTSTFPLPGPIGELPPVSKPTKFKMPFWKSGAPPLPPISPPQRPAHIHEEIRIADKDSLPPFPGAPIPKKKVAKPEDEKVEYGAIARVVSSGMTTGIIATVVVAVAVYFALSLFVFKEEEAILSIPTPAPTETQLVVKTNELDSIFNTVSAVNFSISADKEAAITGFKNFVDGEALIKKQFRRVNTILSTSASNGGPTLLDILDGFGVGYPDELKSYVKENHLVLLYGQDEDFSGGVPNDKVKTRVVLITEISDSSKTMEILKKWEDTIASDFKMLFDLDPANKASDTFLENERGGIKIRYKNFPLPDKSLDYALVVSLTGRYYFIVSNSRESMYSPIDKIVGI